MSGPLLLPVLRDQMIPGWPEHGKASRARYLDAAEAFTRTYLTDAHTTAYSVPGTPHRLTLEAIGLVPWQMVLFLVDVDAPGHGEKPTTSEARDELAARREAWWAAEQDKLAALETVHPGAIVHRTKSGGYRLVWRLASPFVIATTDDKEAWRLSYRRRLLYLARAPFHIEGDPVCADVTRLYRLPTVHPKPGGPATVPDLRGDPAAIGSWLYEPGAEQLGADIETARRLAARHPGAWGPVLRALEPPKAPEGGARWEELRPEDQDEARVWKRAEAYLGSMSASIAGSGGHAALWDAALAMVRGFSLGASTGAAFLWRYFNPRCSPPWDRKTIDRKAREAADKGKLPWGYRRDAEGGEAGLKNKPSERRKRSGNAHHQARSTQPADESPPMPDQSAPENENQGAAGAEQHHQEGAKQAPGNAEPLDPWRYHPTDIGNGERLVARHGRDLHYCGPWGAWLVWDGQRWQQDRHFEVQRRAKETAIGIYQEASAIVGHEDRHELRRKALSSWAKKSESNATREAMISSALSEPGISVTPEELDADPWALNVQNGTIDLRTGRLRDHRRGDKITKLAAVSYDPEATCPRFIGFLRTIMRGDEELIALLQRFFGYALTGEIREHVLLNCFGAGSNGKSTLLGVFVAILGEYAYQAPPDLLLIKKGESHPTDQAGLYGKRLVVCMETPKGRAMDTARMKALTGGDPITARRMREDFWTFTPTHKLVLGSNFKPTVDTTDHGTWRRQKLVPFAVQIPDEKQDRELPAKLMAEGPGILRWALEGCLAWQRQGLGDAAAVREATKAWRDESDPLRAFLAARCEEGEGFTIEAGELYAAYLDFMTDQEGEPLSPKAMGGRLTERGYVRGKGAKGVRTWRGVRLTPQKHAKDGWREADGGSYSGQDHAKHNSPSAEGRSKSHQEPPATQAHAQSPPGSPSPVGSADDPEADEIRFTGVGPEGIS